MVETRKAMSMAENILALDKRTKNTAHISAAMWALRWAHQILGEWDKSLQCLMKARDIPKKTEEYQSSGNATLLLGELFMEMGDYVEAEEYFNESKSIY